jgi:hypothetical protein
MASRRQRRDKKNKSLLPQHAPQAEKPASVAISSDQKGARTAEKRDDESQFHPTTKRERFLLAKNNADERVATFTKWLVLFTAILAIVTCIQVWAFITSERAFLVVDNFSAVPPEFPPKDATQPLVFSAIIRNGGTNGAVVIGTDFVLKNIPKPASDLPATPDYVPVSAGNDLFRGPVIAGSDRAAIFRPELNGKPMVLTTGDYDYLRAGGAKLYVYGYVDYKDEFSLFGSKRSGFCWVYNPKNPPTLSPFDSCGTEKYVYAN